MSLVGGPPSVESDVGVVVKRNQSKYDFVKVRVWVEDHFYVLSRYLVCRALVSTKVQGATLSSILKRRRVSAPSRSAACQINSKDAVQISLDLKRVRVALCLLCECLWRRLTRSLSVSGPIRRWWTWGSMTSCRYEPSLDLWITGSSVSCDC